MKKLIGHLATLGFGLFLIAAGFEFSLAAEKKQVLQENSLLSSSVTPLLTYSDQANGDSAKKKFSEDLRAENNHDIKKAKRFSFYPKPKPECGSFLITEFGYTYRLDRSPDKPLYLNWELGWMMNRNKRSALGGTILFGFNQDFENTRFGLKPRFRWWLTKTESLDLSAGILLPAGKNHSFISPSYTGHVGLNLGDCFALTGQVEVIRRGKSGTDVAWCGGFKLGTPFVAISSSAVAVVIGVLALCSSFSGGIMSGG